ncbi:MAG: FtsQ-type POTRA domain-containing protein [Nocardiopsaceae bacterium]|jgi:cell division protein FtsQ|nr:FtsQ-type POTRA domain-containing protein [Nocardiopsaceae bacterium]
MSQPASTGRRRRDLWKAAFIGLAAVALLGGVAWAVLGSSFLVVRSVRTTGSQVPRSTVLSAAGIKMGTPLARIDTGAIARRVEQVTQVQSARVTLSWPDAVVIWTKRRTAVFMLRAGHHYALVDSYGVVLSRTAERPAGLIALRPGTGRPGWEGQYGQLRSEPAVLTAGAIVRGLPAWLRGRVSAVQAGGAADVILILRDGVRVRWGSQGHGSAKAKEMAILLRTDARYYDVSDPATVVTGGARHSASPGT